MPRASDIAPYLDRIDQSGWYSNFGPLVSEFEARLESRFPAGTRVITTVNGTLGLTLALEALSLPPGSLCALPSWTFVATAHAVRMARLVPWFVDVDPAEGELTPDLLRKRLAMAPGKVTAAIPVAVMGRPLDLAAWRGFQDDTGVRVVVDAAAGFDATRSAPVPVMVSLHATKALGIGEGAFIATEDHELSQRLRAMTNFGFLGDRISRHVATNAKLSEYAAAVGLAALDLWGVHARSIWPPPAASEWRWLTKTESGSRAAGASTGFPAPVSSVFPWVCRTPSKPTCAPRGSIPDDGGAKADTWPRPSWIAPGRTRG
jgi:dTDP-4-amino-4,6-dideoxygalactose transaminase